MDARINLNLLPEQKLYLEKLIKDLSYSFAWYQEAQAKDRKSSATERYWKQYREAEELLKSEFGLENL